MEKINVLETNIVDITGILTDVDMRTGQTADGREYISGRLSIKSVINDIEQVTEAEVFAMKLTKAKTISKLYTAYENLPTMLEKRVTIQGEMTENKFFNADSKSIISYNRIAAKFINIARSGDLDRADFKVAGYVVQPLTETLDAEGAVIGHRIILGIANYNQTLPSYITLNVNDENIARVAGDMYQTGDTIELGGNYVVSVETTEIEREAAFGTLTDSKTRSIRQFVVTSGSTPIETGSYTPELINSLTSAYKQHSIELENAAKEKDSSNALGGAKPKTGFGASLL